MAEKNNKGKPDRIELKELTFVICPKCGTRYPKGSSCPECVAESKR